jgi:hypothetical protein
MFSADGRHDNQVSIQKFNPVISSENSRFAQPMVFIDCEPVR